MPLELTSSDPVESQFWSDSQRSQYISRYPEVAQTFSTTIGPTISDTSEEGRGMTDEMKLRKRAYQPTMSTEITKG